MQKFKIDEIVAVGSTTCGKVIEIRENGNTFDYYVVTRNVKFWRDEDFFKKATQEQINKYNYRINTEESLIELFSNIILVLWIFMSPFIAIDIVNKINLIVNIKNVSDMVSINFKFIFILLITMLQLLIIAIIYKILLNHFNPIKKL